MLGLALGCAVGVAPLPHHGRAFAAGAIAIAPPARQAFDKPSYTLGYAPTSQEAEANALRSCHEAGHTHCEVQLHYDTGMCAAYAVRPGASGTAIAGNEHDARGQALKQCGADCQILVSDCDN